MFYLFHGDDEYRRSLELATMKSKLGDQSAIDLNTTELSGSDLTLDQLIFACDSVPFLSDKRLVIVHGLAARLGRRKEAAEEEEDGEDVFLERLEDYLSNLPETARLVFVENRAIGKGNPIRKMVSAYDHGYEHEFVPLKGFQLSKWISQRVEEEGGKIDRDAVQLLANYVGNDLRLLDQEVGKLLTYVGQGRSISRDDVERLVSYVREASIFDLVDAVGTRNTKLALQLMEKLIDDGNHPLYILHMITRQIRILLQTRELKDKQTEPGDISALLGLHPYVVKKALAQTPNFAVTQLEELLHRLLDVDVAIKTGQMEPVLALELFLTEAGR
ncbi:MAG TPA: DNA polymerase III subunit delta [Chloroflexi bacterium]|nr:DNA polymerase III subunit delta [Chloroflexota bacterium]